jgi:prophage regulatory protein
VPIGARAVGWPEHEVTAINAARIAGKSDAEIRELVFRLEAARKKGSGEGGDD